METDVVIGTKEGTRKGTLTSVRTGDSLISPALLIDDDIFEPSDVPRGWRIYATPKSDRQLTEKAAAVGYPIEGLAPEETEPPVEFLVRKVRRFRNGVKFITIPKEYAQALKFEAGDIVRLYLDGRELRISKKADLSEVTGRSAGIT
jgi:hypothetical protein